MKMRIVNISVSLLLLLASLAGASSCEGVRPAAEESVEMVITPRPMTKGFVEGAVLKNDDNNDRKLVMSCWLRTMTGASYNFFYDEAFSFIDGGWHADPPIYVPFHSSFDLLGYSASRQMAQTDVIWGTPKQVERMRYSLSYDHMQDDVLYGAAYGITSVFANSIQMILYHSQAWIEVRVHLKEGADPSRDVRMKAITAQRTYACADISVEANDGIPTATTDLRHYYAADLPLAASVGGYGEEITFSDSVFRILVPQQLQTSLRLDYSVSGCDFTNIIDMSVSRATWEMSKRYVYEVVFDPISEIMALAGVTVNDWAAGSTYSETI